MSFRSLLLPAALALPLTSPPTRADVCDYVKKQDASTSWKLHKKVELEQGTVYDLKLVSQTWQTIPWTHSVQVYVPKGVRPKATMLLFVTGGRPSPRGMILGMATAERLQAPVAFLYDIPNQPLLVGKREDALIAETFVRYLETGDPDWPLLFPMVKSVVKAMDALQAFARQEWKFELKQFIVAGASKRGWTTWLTAACDGRVKALIPMVIDTLNMAKQLPHQLASFGAYSEMIRDYTKRGLVPLPNTARARELWQMVDPWTYRRRIRQPKLIVNGTNDPYWALDALNLYWDDLRGPKWLLYVPNAGHDLMQKEGKRRDPTRLLSTLAAFVRSETDNRPMPKVEWKREKVGSRARLTVRASPAPKAARWWVAEATTLDFRKAHWTAVPATVKDGALLAVMGPPSSGCRAFFGELEYEVDGQTFYLSTQISIVGKPAR